MTGYPEVPDQPDGIEDESFDLPTFKNAAERVAEFLSWYGDGRIEIDAEADVHEGVPPLYARDLQALVNHSRADAEPSSTRRLSHLEARVGELHAEVDRLRREVEFEANGADTFAGADAIHGGGE